MKAEDIATEKSVALKRHKYVIDTAGVTKSHRLVIDTAGVTKSHTLVIDTTRDAGNSLACQTTFLLFDIWVAKIPFATQISKSGLARQTMLERHKSVNSI